jgi:aspartyl-tRNA(Asn)/glutamyl-tRNA(Gln) amidotransferase subunit A
MALARSVDCISPTAKHVEDAEILFNEIKGIDSMDSTTVEVNNSNLPADGVKTIGVPRSFLKEGIDPDILENFENSLKKLEKEGYEIIDLEIPLIDKSLSVYYILVPSEISANMARYDGVKFGQKVEGKDLMDTYLKTRGQLLGKEVKRRIILGTYLLSAGYADQYYRKAWQVRGMIRENFKKVFEKVDLIAMPVAPTPAFKIGEKSNDPLKMYLNDIFTGVANVVGVPAISIPSGMVEREGKDLPVGFQLIAPHLGEEMLFAVGKHFERID